MPYYEYACDACGKLFEMKRGVIDATAPAACPKCGHTARRVFSAPTMIMIK